jgi:hypothetical protein
VLAGRHRVDQDCGEREQRKGAGIDQLHAALAIGADHQQRHRAERQHDLRQDEEQLPRVHFATPAGGSPAAFFDAVAA